MWQTSLQVGQLVNNCSNCCDFHSLRIGELLNKIDYRFLCLRRDLTRQTLQKLWPHDIDIGSQMMVRQRLHSKERRIEAGRDTLSSTFPPVGDRVDLLWSSLTTLLQEEDDDDDNDDCMVSLYKLLSKVILSFFLLSLFFFSSLLTLCLRRTRDSVLYLLLCHHKNRSQSFLSCCCNNQYNL